MPFYLVELMEKLTDRDRVQIVEANQAKLKVCVVMEFLTSLFCVYFEDWCIKLM